jgi:hypothetical protein
VGFSGVRVPQYLVFCVVFLVRFAFIVDFSGVRVPQYLVFCVVRRGV